MQAETCRLDLNFSVCKQVDDCNTIERKAKKKKKKISLSLTRLHDRTFCPMFVASCVMYDPIMKFCSWLIVCTLVISCKG